MLEDIVSLTMMSLYGVRNVMGIVLEDDDEAKLKFLTSVTTAFKTSGKSTCISWLRYFDEGKGNQIRLVLEDLLSY